MWNWVKVVVETWRRVWAEEAGVPEPVPVPPPPVPEVVPAERAVRVYLQKHRLGIQLTGLEGVDASGLQRPPQELWCMNSAN